MPQDVLEKRMQEDNVPYDIWVKKGYITFRLTKRFTPKKYTIKAAYKGYKIKNKIKVKRVIFTKKTFKVKKSSGKLVLKAKLKQGKKLLKYKKVTFKFKGKKYKVKTNKKGIAKLTIKQNVIKKLKDLAEKSEFVYLATDPDREGEAISWHLAQILKLDMSAENRICFNEITKSGIKAGMSNPRKIDLDLVDAQQARRVLDRIVVPSFSNSCRMSYGVDVPPTLCRTLLSGYEVLPLQFLPRRYCQFPSQKLRTLVLIIQI